jgi:hypothetical protein
MRNEAPVAPRAELSSNEMCYEYLELQEMLELFEDADLPKTSLMKMMQTILLDQ